MEGRSELWLLREMAVGLTGEDPVCNLRNEIHPAIGGGTLQGLEEASDGIRPRFRPVHSVDRPRPRDDETSDKEVKARRPRCTNYSSVNRGGGKR